MQHSQKVVVSPYEAEESPQMQQEEHYGGEIFPTSAPTEPPKKRGNAIRDHALDRQRRMLAIVLKLAKVNGFNENFEIRGTNGSYINRSDVIALVLNAVTPGKHLLGLSEFVQLLKEASISPDLITNENVKVMLGRVSQRLNQQRPSVIVKDGPPVLERMEMHAPMSKPVKRSAFTADDLPALPDEDAFEAEALGPQHIKKRKRDFDDDEPHNEQGGSGWIDYDSD